MKFLNQDKEQRAKQIQQAIREILVKDWDPIGVSDNPKTPDEYDAYIGSIYRLLASNSSEDKLIKHLADIETNAMGLGPPAKPDHHRPVAKKLLALNVSL